MKTVKPSRLSVLHRTLENEGRPWFVVTAFAGFRFARPKELVGEIELWPLCGKLLMAEGGVLDEGHEKVRGELLVTGSCFPPGGPAPLSYVRVSVAEGERTLLDKRLVVVGDREWQNGVPTDPKPFDVMPVDWTRAFGGEGYAPNPKGVGDRPVEIDGVRVHALPNIEDWKHLVRGTSDTPTPVGLAAYDVTWPQRFSKVGTYDQQWLETRAFSFPRDMDPTLFNAAPEDQWLAGPWSGRETFVLENMHPDKARLTGELPPLVVRVFLTLRDAAGAQRLREVPMHVDTLRLFPDEELGVLVFRGSTFVAEDDAADVIELVIAGEDRSAPRPPEHYEQALVLRRDKSKGGLASLRESDLMPPRELGWTVSRPKTSMDELVRVEHHLHQNLMRRIDIETATARADLEASGLDPKAFGLDDPRPAVPEIDPDDPDDFIAKMEEQEKKQQEYKDELAEKNAAVEELARKTYEEQGLDYDAAVADALREAAGPPKYDAKRQLEWMRSMLKVARDNEQPLAELEALAADPKYEAELERGERRLKDAYRMGAHMKDPVPRVSRADSEFMRTELEVAHHNDIKLEAINYSGADFSEMSLPKIDLAGGFLEAVELRATDLRGAKLDNAVLAHAHLEGTLLAGASCVGTNFGKAHFDGADLSGCDLKQATLFGAHLERTSLRGTKLERVQLIETTFGAGVVLDEAEGQLIVMVKLDLRGATFKGAHLTKSVLIECDLRGANLDGVDSTRTCLYDCPADGATFRGAVLDATQFVGEAMTLVGASFEGAYMPRALLRGLDLTGAKFAGATLEAADLSGSKLCDADLEGISARNALCIRTDFSRAELRRADLLSAILQKALLFGANFDGANLFQADLAKIRVDGNTRIDSANLKRVNVYPKAK